MKSAVETLNPTRVKLTIEVPFDELKPMLDKAYATIGSQVSIPGFRSGKVPARIIDQRVGRGAVVQEAVSDALPEFYSQAVTEHELNVIGQPDADVTAVPLEEGQNLEFTIETDVIPQVTLPELSGRAVTVDAIEVSDTDVDAQLDTLRERFGTLVTVDRKVKDGDFVSIDLTAQIDGEEIDSVEGISYEVGSGNLLEGTDQALIGLKAGDSKTFNAPLAGGDRAGTEAEVTVRVEAVKERELPELDDEFAQLASQFDTIDELRDDARGQVERAKRFEQGIQARDLILEELLNETDIPVPQGILAAEVHSHLEGEGRVDDAQHEAEVSESTTRALQAQFLLDAIARERDVRVEDNDLIEYLVASAQQYGMDPNTFAQAVQEQGQINAMVGEVARRKGLASVLDDAVVTDSNGDVVDLQEIVPEGDDAAETAEVAEADATPEAEAPKKKSAKKAPAKKATKKDQTSDEADE